MSALRKNLPAIVVVIVICAVLAVFFVAMSNINRVVSSELFEGNYEILHVNKPKHFYLDLRDVETGKVYKKKYISKHCNSYRETAVVGETYTLKVKRRFYEDGTTDLRFTPSRKIFCGY